MKPWKHERTHSTDARMAQIIPAQHGKTIPHVRTEIRVPAYIKNPFQEKYDTDTFPNQRQFAKDIARVFQDKTAIHVLAVAPTQSGKTGTMLAIQREFAEQKAIRVKKTHMFIFTGLSSLEWLEQTKNRFPEFMTPHIFHRNQWKKAVTKIHGLTNVLIIIDECHIAAKTQQTLHKFAQHIWNHDISKMYTQNIKLIQFTATPQRLEQEYIQKWGTAHHTLYMDVPKQYISVQKLLQQHRVKHAKDLCGVVDKQTMNVLPHVHEHIQEIADIVATMKPAYHIIRTPRAQLHQVVIHNFKTHMPHYNCISTMGWDNHKFDHTLNTQPNTHTFIFIKDKLRVAKTIQHKFIGILYEKITHNNSHATIAQGLLGRNTGYHTNHNSIVFTDTTKI